MAPNRNSAPRIEIPEARDDHPSWIKIGIIAIVGFGIGVAWPRVAGIRLGPKAPSEFAQATGSSRAPDAPSPVQTAQAPSASLSAPQTTGSAAGAAAASASSKPAGDSAPKVNVSRGSILSCKAQDGESKKGKECGTLAGLDAMVVPRMKKLANCAGAVGKSGKVSGVMSLDFGNNKYTVDVGKSSTVEGVDGIRECLKSDLAGLNIGTIEHENARYNVVFNATLVQPTPEAATNPAGNASASAPGNAEPQAPATAAASGPEETVKDGASQVVWEVALVRDVPKSGQIVAHLPRGTKVKALTSKDGWYKIQFGSQEGWVYRGSIGK